MLVLLALAASCNSPPGADGSGDQSFSCEAERTGYQYLQYPLVDLLIVIDRSAAMAPFAAPRPC